MKNLFSVLIALLFLSQAAWAGEMDAPSEKGFGSKGYSWNRMTPERTEALRLGGDVARGKEAFRGCRGCHKADGAGLMDGTYPRLSGQHANVIIKQITEMRAGIRKNPKMLPFVEDPAISVPEIADIAAYLATLESTRENGKGPEDLSARGKKLYLDNKCDTCHGKNGEGDASKPYPAVAAQHYGYLLRELRYISEGTRGNSNPDMVKAISKFKQRDLEAVADYLSRLPDYRTVKTSGAAK